MDLAAQRREYRRAKLRRADLEDNPFKQFTKWFHEAQQDGVLEPNAMILTTVSASGQPSARTVLLKGFDEEGFVFYTNYASRKADEMVANTKVALLFPWLIMERQVKIHGVATKVSQQESEEYFRTRPRGSQIGAWVSPQSSILESREQLERAWDSYSRKYAEGDIPRPENWGGYRVAVSSIEFWQGGENRLHDRLVFNRDGESWTVERLAP